MLILDPWKIIAVLKQICLHMKRRQIYFIALCATHNTSNQREVDETELSPICIT